MPKGPSTTGDEPTSTSLFVAIFAMFVAATGCQLPPNTSAGGGLPSPDAGGVADASATSGYTIVVLPDTQYYSSSWPNVLAAQTRWILEHRDSHGIAFVLQAGDLVDSDVPSQWEVASRSLHELDGRVPYVVASGNHDYSNLADRMGMGNVYFPPSAFSTLPWFGGTFEPEHIENSFSLIPAGSVTWLVLSLEFGPRDEVIAWADTILKRFPERPAIVLTHAYMHHAGSRYDHQRGSQAFNPHDYVMMGQPGTSINDGEELWTKLISPNTNVKLVFSGHDVSGADLPPGTTARLTSVRPDGSRVHQLLANYQTCLGPPCRTSPQGSAVYGGSGYLRLLRFVPASGAISVSTYSPYRDSFLTDPGNQFQLEAN